MKKLNFLGKLAITAIVVLAIFGVWKISNISFGSSAEAIVTGFAASIEDMNYTFAYNPLSSEIQKAGSEPAFAARLAEKFGGEKLIVELCKGKPLEEIKGLIYKKDKEIIENPDEIDLDLSKLPFPKYKKFELKDWKRNISAILPICLFGFLMIIFGLRMLVKK